MSDDKLKEQAQTFDSFSKFFAWASKETKDSHKAWKYRRMSEMATEMMIITESLQGFAEEQKREGERV